MHSDKQVKTKRGSAISYHALVSALIKVFPRFSDFKKNGLISQAHVETEFDLMASKLELCHAAIGIATEAGEVADILKAHAIYGKPFDRDAMVKELGDVRFWIQDIQNKFNISDHEIAQGNADKLSERYDKMTYSDEAAIKRVDKKFVIAVNQLLADEGLYLAGPFEHEYEANNCWREGQGFNRENTQVFKLI